MTVDEMTPQELDLIYREFADHRPASFIVAFSRFALNIVKEWLSRSKIEVLLIWI